MMRAAWAVLVDEWVGPLHRPRAWARGPYSLRGIGSPLEGRGMPP